MATSITLPSGSETAIPVPLPILSHWIDGRPVKCCPSTPGPSTTRRPARSSPACRAAAPPEVDAAAVAAAKAAFPGLARHAAHRPQPGLLRLPRARVAAPRGAGGARSPATTARPSLTRSPRSLRGIETVEFACGLPVHLAGMNTPNVATQRRRASPCASRSASPRRSRPFNFPAMVPMWIYPIALACGNTFVLKPSARTRRARPSSRPSCGRRPGCPDGVFNIVYGGREAVTAIVEHPDVQAIQFVGSTAVGRYVYETGTRRGKRVGAFTSAKNAMVVLPDADMEMAADARRRRRLRLGRRAVHGPDARDRRRRHRRPAPAAHRSSGSRGSRSARAWSPAWTWARSTPQEHRESVIDWIDKGVAEGAELVVDGRPVRATHEHPDGFFLGVSLFDHVTPGDGDLQRGDLRAGPRDRPRRRPTTRRSASSTATSTPTAPRSSRPTAAPPGASSSRSTSR